MHRSWVSPFFLGIAIAVVVESGLGLLLFVSPGLLPALTLILAVALGSLGLGLASSPTGSEQGGRWRWFLATGGLLVAAALSLGWSFEAQVSQSPLGRGVNLAGLVAFPLYALGAALSTAIHPTDGARSGSAAALGGMVGAVFLGTVLVPRLEPVSVYLFCVLCVSVAALGHPRP